MSIFEALNNKDIKDLFTKSFFNGDESKFSDFQKLLDSLGIPFPIILEIESK
jgi:hypothetical protein